MTSINSIQIKFASESQYEKYPYKAEKISYGEILKEYLVAKKKLVIPTDKDKT